MTDWNKKLLEGAISGDLRAVKQAVKNGADLYAQFLDAETYAEMARTALHQAAYHNHPKIIQYLVSIGADVDYATKSGCSPLETAALANSVESAKVLLKLGAKVDGVDPENCGTVHTAVGNTSLEVLEVLVKAGANVNLADTELDVRPLHMAMGTYSDHDEGLEVVRYLLKAGADVNAKNRYGETALHKCASSGTPRIAELLIAHGADVFIEDAKGRNALDHCFTMLGREPYAHVALLLMKHMGIGLRDEYKGKTLRQRVTNKPALHAIWRAEAEKSPVRRSAKTKPDETSETSPAPVRRKGFGL